MNTLRVTITADGLTRTFRGDGDGPAVVAAFRAWLSSPDFWLPMADGADALDLAAARLEQGQDAPVFEPALAAEHDAPPAVAPRPSAPVETTVDDVRRHVLAALMTGASYTPRELHRDVHRQIPDAGVSAIVGVLEILHAKGIVERLSGAGSDARYRRKAQERGR